MLAGCTGEVGAGAVADDELRGRIPLPTGARAARVVRVVDGDTVVLSGLGSSRLIGVDTPEVHGRPECFGREAAAFLRRVLERGARASWLAGSERRDRYGRKLVYLWLADGRSLNAMLVEGGYARPLPIPPTDRYAERFESLARGARRRDVGRWADGACSAA